jgi:O-antigen ligase
MFAALIVVAFTLPFMDLEIVRLGGRSIVLPYAAACLLLVPMLPRLNEAARHVRHDRTLPWLVALFLAACLSTTWNFFWYQRAEIFDRNLTQLANLLMMVGQYVLFVGAFRLVPAHGMQRVVRAMLWTGLAGAIYSLYQFASVYLDLPTPDLFRTSTLYLKLNTLGPTGAGGWAGVPRAFGAAPEPSFWGGYLALTMALALARLRVAPRASSGIVVAVVALALVVTFSRGAWLTTGAMLAVCAASLFTKRMALAATAVLVAMLALTVWPLVAGGAVFDRLTDLSAVGRLASQQTGWRIVLDHPVLGIGLGSAEFLVQRYNVLLPSINAFPLEHLYNFYLLVLVSTGLLGFCLFVGFLLALVTRIGAAFAPAAVPGWLGELRLGAALLYVACLGFWLNTPGYNFTFVWFALSIVSVTPAVIDAAVSSPRVAGRSRACASPSI